MCPALRKSCPPMDERCSAEYRRKTSVSWRMEGIPSGFKASVIFIQAEISASVSVTPSRAARACASRMAASMVSRAVPGCCTPRYGTL